MFNVLLFAALCSALQTPLKEYTSKTPLDSIFDKKVSEALEHFHVPGLAVSVVYGPHTCSKGYGWAKLNDRGDIPVSPDKGDIPMTPNTLLYPGSTTKAFTAASMSLLIDEIDDLEWDTPIATLIRDEFVLSDEYSTTHITLEDTLSHRTGMPRHDFTYGWPNATVADIVRNMRTLPLAAELRTKFQYCNIMFTTVGYVIERISGKKLADFFHDRIWKPLGMLDTYASVNDAKNSDRYFATGYFWDNDTMAYKPMPYAPIHTIGGAGALISTVQDYAKWLRMMISRSAPLSKEGHESIMTPRSMLEPELLGVVKNHTVGDGVYALGWWKYVYRGQQVVAHGGSIRGFGALALFLPDLEWGVTIFANTQGTSNMVADILAYHLIDEMLGIPQEKRLDLTAAYDKLMVDGKEQAKTAAGKLYPSVPSPPVKPSLPFEAYNGTYFREAYGSLTFELLQPKPSDTDAKVPQLHTTADMKLLAYDLTLEHVSGEYWIVTMADLYTGESGRKTRAEFKLTPEGKVSELGIELDDYLAKLKGEKIWFRRQE